MNIPMVAANVTKWVAYGPVTLKQVVGYNNNASDVWIQFHEKPVPVAGDVPTVKSIWAPANTPFEWDFPALSMSELHVALSTTEADYTAVGGGAGLDMTLVGVQSDFLVTPTTTVVGDLTTGVSELIVWAESAGWKRLLRLDVINNDVATKYILVQATDASSANHSGNTMPVKILTTEHKKLFYGREGLQPFEQSADGTASAEGTYRKGCVVRIGHGATQPYAFDSNTNYNIQAIYA